ncbi:hypothetical protein SK3146_01940 [Paenibacillus konkukensis]|uniref:Uncharacterized protein n=1 Tax=Paenibacillus konkukensis TaxID=2020716 RepID=A0ABY4RLL6_9BACL|nr:hypothetical protein [Paenibacillus konkukensis]UQZ82780.1 hypothetical protein SK3146_01940 [Paenibacillus konkukensis]
MKKFGLRTVHPYVWLVLGGLLLIVLFAAVYSVSKPGVNRATQVSAAETNEDRVKLFPSPPAYQVLEAYKEKNPDLPGHDFGPLQLGKVKLNRGFALTVKKAQVTKQYKAADERRMIYFIERELTQEEQAWTQMDIAVAEPSSGQYATQTVGYTYGPSPEPFEQSTLLCGFVSDDEFLYTTVLNADQEWIYQVNKFDLSQKTITPVMELFRYEPLPGNGPAVPPVIYSAELTPDKQHLFVRDSLNGIANYNLITGKMQRLIGGSNELRAGEHFETIGTSGIALFGANRYQSDIYWIDMNAGTVKQPFVQEKGYVDPGTDAKGKVMYYNFTYDRAPEQIMQGDNRTLLLSSGVQLVDLQGNLLKRFALPQDSKERLEFGGYSESKKSVLLHKYIMATGSKGQPYKKTVSWLIGDMTTGNMTVLNKVDVPDGWDKNDIVFGKICIEPLSPVNEEQVFVNVADNSYYMSRWKTKQVDLRQEEDVVTFVDEPSKRVFVSSFTRPDLLVAAFSYKKYNWDNQDFSWLDGHWMARHQSQTDGDKIFFFQVN